MYLQEITWIIGIISFVGGIAVFLFKKIVIDPLQKSINSLTDTLKEFRLGTNKQLEIQDKEIDLLKLKTTKHDVQIESLLKTKESV